MQNRLSNDGFSHQSGLALAAIAAIALAAAGCLGKSPPVATASSGKALPVAAPGALTNRPPEKVEEVRQPVADPQPSGDRATLSRLAEAALAAEFEQPPIDEGKIAAAGIRKLAGQHIVIYTDLPAAAEVDELPQVFDTAVPLWCDYFGIDRAKTADWKIVGSVMKDKDRFAGAGLFPERLPDFAHGFNVGSQLWLYDQPSGYFRRHLLLHEGTHAFMLRWLGGAGPPWYMEGLAELLGTHRWQGGVLTLGVMPASRDEVPYWGRIKIVKQELAAGRGLSLTDIMQYGPHAHLQLEAYGWCWAAAAFLDQHPSTQAAFRELKRDTRDRTVEFSNWFRERVQADWPAIALDWQLFVHDCDYGYDFSRAAVQHKAAIDLPSDGATVTLATDRGWQSTGYRLEAGKKYQLTASGRYQIAGDAVMPWPCEANGVTIRYSGGQPLGMLLAGVADDDANPQALTPLASPLPIGATGQIEPTATGTIYLKINEPASGLHDNDGTLSVTIRKK